MWMDPLLPSFPPFKSFLELRDRAQARPLELPYPTVGDRVDRHRIDEMELPAALALRRQQLASSGMEIRQRAEDSIVVVHLPNMQPDGCLSRGARQPYRAHSPASLMRQASPSDGKEKRLESSASCFRLTLRSPDDRRT